MIQKNEILTGQSFIHFAKETVLNIYNTNYATNTNIEIENAIVKETQCSNNI